VEQKPQSIILRVIMKDSSFIQPFLDMLKREDVKKEMNLLLKPMIHFILYEIYPYLCIIFAFIFVLFFMILAILIILIIMLRNRDTLTKSILV
jgi:hypothetical protein